MKWVTYQGAIPVDLEPYQAPDIEHGAVLMADCFSRNGAYGCVWIIKHGEQFYLQAGGNDSGKLWKSPDQLYDSIAEAAAVAEKLWKPV